MKKWLKVAIGCYLFIGFSLFANPDLLKTRDINHIMQQIFDQHVEKKEMTAAIVKNAFKVYIDQFDPERIYLLDADVRPYLDVDESVLSQSLKDYKAEKFDEFEKLNGTIQTAILRARQIRGKIEEDKKLLLNSPPQSLGDYNEWTDPDLKVSFAKTIPQLKERMTRHIIRFVEAEKRQFGNTKIEERGQETLNIYNQHLTDFENQYLFATAGQPMPPAQKENLFTFHVLKALASSLDAHTSVLNPGEAYDMRVRLEKGFQGIGIAFIQSPKGELLVKGLVDGGPAAKNGQIRVGDQLLEINGQSTSKLSLEQAIGVLRSAGQDQIKLKLKRASSDAFFVELKKDSIAVKADRVETGFEPYDNGIIGKITLHSFYQGANGVSSENDVIKALKDLSAVGPIKGLILDLRENSGGFLTQAVKVAGLFISNGVVVVSKYSNGEEHFYRDINSKVSFSGPLIILTSKATASAAEIVAQALQDYGVGIVVGDEHTYGKGTIQSQTVTDNASPSYFKVTIGKYYTVSGKTPQLQGVKADIVIPSPLVDEHIGEEYLDSTLKADLIDPSFNDTLADIDPSRKSWYLHYYTPTIQHYMSQWKDMIGTLSQNAAARLQRNSLYKKFIASEHSRDLEADKIRKQYWIEDVQMQEAVNIVKDMVTLQNGALEKTANTAERRVGSIK